MKKICAIACAALLMTTAAFTALAQSDGKQLYARCQGCHAPDASKLLKSKAEADVLKALEGYKAKNYGGEKKTVMENMVKNLSDEDIKALAKYMSTL